MQILALFKYKNETETELCPYHPWPKTNFAFVNLKSKKHKKIFSIFNKIDISIL